jgi:glycine dehydrogenase
LAARRGPTSAAGYLRRRAGYQGADCATGFRYTHKGIYDHVEERGPHDTFVPRHIGPSDEEVRQMLDALGYDSLDDLIDATIPADIRLERPLRLGPPRDEADVLEEIRGLAARNEVFRSYIGMGYHDTITPPVILRNILENPGWYTAYTPYQAEIAQGRLEALLNFQTMVVDLTGLPIANASLLDEGTAAAEAMALCYGARGKEGKEVFFVAELCHPQTIDVVRTRAAARGIEVVVGDHESFDFDDTVFGALLQYPDTYGAIRDYRGFVERAHAAGAMVVVAADLLSADAAHAARRVGRRRRGRQHAAVRRADGVRRPARRLHRDARRAEAPAAGPHHRPLARRRRQPALRMALQTREQHIRREKATSNICTAQVLLAVIAGMYAVYHGPEGLRRIAERVHLRRDAGGGAAAAGDRRWRRGRSSTRSVGSATRRGRHAAAPRRADQPAPHRRRDLGVSLDETVTAPGRRGPARASSDGATSRRSTSRSSPTEAEAGVPRGVRPHQRT